MSRKDLLRQSLLGLPLIVAGAQALAQQSSVVPASTSGRTLLSQPARLTVENVPLRIALAKLVERSEVPLALSPSRLPTNISVSCACESLTVADALNVLLAETAFTYREAGGYVLLIPSTFRRERAFDAADAMVRDIAEELRLRKAAPVIQAPYFASSPVPRPKRAVITGTVRNRAGVPVAGALISLARLQLSAQSNEAGVYQLIVPEDQVSAREDTLRVTRIGYSPSTVPFQLGSATIRLDIVINEQVVKLDEVLVSGTAGSQLRRAQSAEVATVDASKIMRTAPITSVSQLLASRVAGVSVGESNGAVGGTTLIRIRGVSSISLSNEPLVFVDGVKIDYRHMTIGGGTGNVSTLSDLSPSDIESIEVVKGPAAATLYGADASAGVIQILTKRGTLGSTQFRQTLTVDAAVIEPNWTPPANFATCGAADVAPTSLNPCNGLAVGSLISDSPLQRGNILNDGLGRSVRWSGRGGDRNYGFFTSLGYNRETGVLPQNEMIQSNGRANFTFLPHPTLNLDASLGLTRDINRQPQLGDGTYSMMLALVGNPLSIGGAADGWIIPGRTGTAISNIRNEFANVRVIPSVKVSYTPQRWFTNRLTIGTDLSRVRYERFLPRNDQGWYTPIENTGFIQQNRYAFDTHTFDYLGNLDHSFGAGQDLRADLSFGMQVIATHVDSALTSGTGLASNASNVVSSATTVNAGGGWSDQRSVGYFGQLQFGYRDRLFTQFGARIDRNSAFGTAAGSFFLPKVGMSYVVSDEDYWQRTFPFINTFLVRAAYGTTGRSPTPGASLRTFAPAPYVSGPGVSAPGVILLSPGNDSLRAERGTEFEAGIETGAGDDRLGLKLTYFSKLTRDLLLQSPLPPSMGFQGAPFVNIGRVVNRGVEAQLNAEIIRMENLAWGARLGVSTLHNEIESLGGLAPIRIGIQNSSHFRVGEPLGVFYGRRVVSTDVAGGRAIVSDTAQFIGNSIPKLEGNFSTDLTLFRNLVVSGLLDWKRGHYKFNLTDWFRERASTTSERYQKRADLPDDQRLRLFGPYFTADGTAVAASSIFEDYIQHASFVRIREVSVTYDAPSRMVTLLRANTASLTIGVRNLALWTDYRFGDPESVSYVPRDGRFAAAEFNTLPQTRRWYTRVSLLF
ncbi:MAG TPA: SusC/RagA family TonB-linked outer membrane protein [Gemmatimonadaceae bacterium]|nr:SusC/RagA family TonB-linked outer membrane protein [Gemmatimonadaceae bacterium]